MPAFQPAIVPSSVAKRKSALLPRLLGLSRNPGVVLNTCPVGADVASGGESGGGGIVTTKEALTPVPVVKRADPGSVVRYPEGTAWRMGDAPGIDQKRIGIQRGRYGLIVRYEIQLGERSALAAPAPRPRKMLKASAPVNPGAAFSPHKKPFRFFKKASPPAVFARGRGAPGMLEVQGGPRRARRLRHAGYSAGHFREDGEDLGSAGSRGTASPRCRLKGASGSHTRDRGPGPFLALDQRIGRDGD